MIDKRIDRLEKLNPDELDATIRFQLFPRWREGEDVSSQLNEIFSVHPDWRENPPGSIGKNAYIMWDEFTRGAE